MRWFKSILTDENWDFDAVLTVIVSTVVFDCVMTAIKGSSQFDATSFGNSIATIIGAGGMGYAAKRLGEKIYAKVGSIPPQSLESNSDGASTR